MTKVKYAINPQYPERIIIFASTKEANEVMGIDPLNGRREFPAAFFDYFRDEWYVQGLEFEKTEVTKKTSLGTWEFVPVEK